MTNTDTPTAVFPTTPAPPAGAPDDRTALDLAQPPADQDAPVLPASPILDRASQAAVRKATDDAHAAQVDGWREGHLTTIHAAELRTMAAAELALALRIHPQQAGEWVIADLDRRVAHTTIEGIPVRYWGGVLSTPARCAGPGCQELTTEHRKFRDQATFAVAVRGYAPDGTSLPAAWCEQHGEPPF